MREEPSAVVDAGSGREGLKRSDPELDRKYRVALVLYAILAVLVGLPLMERFHRRQAGGVEVDSTAHHRWLGVAHRGGDEGG